MTEEGFDLKTVILQVEVHMCYGQQRQTLPIRVPDLRLKNVDDIRFICDSFNATYAEKYGEGACYPEAGIEMVEVRLNAIGTADKHALKRVKKDRRPEASRTGTRSAYWGPESGFIDTPIYRRETLGAGVEMQGPVLCEAEDTVIVTPPGWKFRTDQWGTGWVERLD